MDFIVTAFRAGGPFMYVILVVLITGIAIMVERAIFILGRNRIDNNAFVNRVLEFVQHNNIKSAIEFCSVSNAALPKVTRAGLEEANKSAADIQNAFELAALAEIPKLEKRTQYLSMIANISTLLGLLGTIFGLISSFEAVSSADASMKATLLSGGISQAMNTTAFGLIAAIPCMIGYSIIQEKTNELIDEINQNVARIYKRLIAAKTKKGK
ncbi:MotA/TolQ/ExbB proton channel family protein [candidate division KSB1 bacterium]|nr:MotA/TolQ/ExbB proton channel family protein [candidate division KSB1 bacterium]MBL7092994.1 MotA/TolQ/ExbB proton channel family protein [candidate division KSB1 bacterium]